MANRNRSLLARALFAVVLASTPLALATEVLAQGAPPSDAVKDVARQRYEQGVKALDEKRYEDARIAFDQAYALTSSPAVLLNLAVSEANSNRCVDAGNHLHRFLREHKAATPANKTLATSTLEECKKKAALLNISVDAPGADVAVDGKSVGKSPIEDPFFVEPGPHVVVATKDGKSGTTKTDVAKGTSANVIVSLGGGTAAPLNPVGPNPTDPNTPAPQIGQPIMPMQPVQPTPDTGGEDFGEWYARKPLAWVGTGVVGVGLGVSIAFSALSADSLSTTNQIADQIRKEKQTRGVSGSPCSEEDGGGDAEGFEGACAQLRDADSIHSANQAVMAVGWVVTGLAAAGTVTYIMLDWYAGSRVSGTNDANDGPTVTFAPIISPDAFGGTFVGAF